jgi:TPP-dependent pyruvate/acetoin dehydrogenase alpha subunit
VFKTQCIKLCRQGLIVGHSHPYLGEEAVLVIEREIGQQMETATDFARSSPYPSVEKFLEEVTRS